MLRILLLIDEGKKMKKEIFIQLKPGSSTEFTDVSTDAKIPAQEARSEW